MDWLTSPEAWIALFTLTILEIVLGIDNIVFISILAGKLPAQEQAKARTFGLTLAMLTRLALLFSLSWVIGLTEPIFTLLSREVAGRDLIMLTGGLFLLGKATHEIHDKLEGVRGRVSKRVTPSFTAVVIQAALLDIIFSLDSVITAVGMADHLAIMVIAVVISVGIMLLSVGAISSFVEGHPTIKMLALSFLLLIGMSLIAEGLGQHIPKGYIYFAMGFSVFVELLNLRLRESHPPVELRQPYVQED